MRPDRNAVQVEPRRPPAVCDIACAQRRDKELLKGRNALITRVAALDPVQGAT